MNIAILGGGSFGMALAIHLSKKHNVKVWEFFSQRVESLKSGRCPLLDRDVPKNIYISVSKENVIIDSEIVIIAVASSHVKSILSTAKITSPILIASKGFDDSLFLLSEVVKEKYNLPIAVLSGPTIAKELVRNTLTCADIACTDKALAEKLCKDLSYDNLRCYPKGDLIGVQVGGALKNVVAVWGGIADGLNLGMNTKAALMTLGMQEISRLGIAMGAHEETFYGMSGIGDLIVTCSSQNSRNRQLGQMLGNGIKLDNALSQMTMVAEGVHTSKVAVKLARKFNVPMPLAEGLYDVMFNGKDALVILKDVIK